MNIKKLITAGIMVMTALAAFAEPVVTDVVAKQRYPWNGLVDITCKVTGINGTTNALDFAVAVVMPDTGDVRKVSHFWVMQGETKSTDHEVHTNGNYHLLWDAQANLGQVCFDNMVVRVTTVKGHGKVQLWEGGPYWAETNIGAEEPEEYGYYFWWGDTVGYTRSGGTRTYGGGYYDDSGVTWVSSTGQQMSSSPFSSSSCPTYDKNNSELLSAGYIDSTGTLAPAHDAAHVHWGGKWRMPTSGELYALFQNCNRAQTTMNGVWGYIFMGRGTYASASIFLPCGAGYGWSTMISHVGSDAWYWSSVPGSDNESAWYLGINSREHWQWYFGRCKGLPVRPVQGFAE